MDLRRIFEKHRYWQDILLVTEKISRAGHQVYLAGGCVRDALMGRAPHDFDVATSATPDEIAEIFPTALDVGRQFGVMIVPFEGYQVEITTFRSDGQYIDGRHPEKVTFSSPEEDAQRRDFTVNALFYDLNKHQVVDYVSGLDDLEKNILRTVGSPQARFQEDKLRMLRAARFAAQLGFDVEPETLSAIRALAKEIKVVSRERITDEFKKLAKSQDPIKGFVILKSTTLLDQLWPQLPLIYNKSYWPLFLKSLQLLSPIGSFEVMVTSFILMNRLCQAQDALPFSGPTTKEEMAPFVLSRESHREIDFLIRGFFVIKNRNDEGLLLLNEDSGPLLTEIGFAYAALGLIESDSVASLVENFLDVADTSGHLPKPILSGEDLKRMGFKPSPQMGEILREVYMRQIKGELRSKKAAQDWVLRRFDS